MTNAITGGDLAAPQTNNVLLSPYSESSKNTNLNIYETSQYKFKGYCSENGATFIRSYTARYNIVNRSKVSFKATGSGGTIVANLSFSSGASVNITNGSELDLSTYKGTTCTVQVRVSGTRTDFSYTLEKLTISNT